MAMPAEKQKEIGNSYADYCSWEGDERWELIYGAPYAMGPAPSTQHQRIVVELLIQIHEALKNGISEVFIAPFDVRLPEADEIDEEITTVIQPDIVVVCDLEKIDEKGCRGAPDWIIEVTSPHTARTDHIRKLKLYELHGVKEYWLVHPVDGLVTIFVQGENNTFKPPTFHAANEIVASSVLPDLQIDLNTIFKHLDLNQ